MENYPKLLFRAAKFAWTEKNSWFLGFIQIFCLYFVWSGSNWALWNLTPKVLWNLGLVFICSLATVMLWLKVKAYQEQEVFLLGVNFFLLLSSRIFGLMCLGFILAFILKVLAVNWAVFAVFTSFALAFLACAMLSTVLCKFTISKSLFFTVDFLKHNISTICGIAVVVILANAYAFYISHSYWSVVRNLGGFSVSRASATIWVVFFLFTVLSAFFSALANAFLVILFLDIIQPKKDPEHFKNPVIEVVLN